MRSKRWCVLRPAAPWAAAVRGMANVVLNNAAAAEKEFVALRASVTPWVGDYRARELIDTYRLVAATYAGRSQELLAASSHLTGARSNILTLNLGRAYLERGEFAEAERQLNLALKMNRLWGNPDSLASHNFLCYTLAQFYLGRVAEQTGKKAEAVNAYQEFLSHFENSNAKLLQIAEARAALKRLL